MLALVRHGSALYWGRIEELADGMGEDLRDVTYRPGTLRCYITNKDGTVMHEVWMDGGSVNTRTYTDPGTICVAVRA